MKTRPRVPFFRHQAATLVLRLLDAQRKLRRLFSRKFLLGMMAVLVAGLLVMAVSSILALRQVTRSVEQLIGDSMVGVETAVAMRATVRETQLDLLRMRVGHGQPLDEAAALRVEKRVHELLRQYRNAAFEKADEDSAVSIEQRLADYMQKLRPIAGAVAPTSDDVAAADNAARELVESVEAAYQFNRERVRQRAGEAGAAAQVALQISNLLWWAFGLFALLLALAYASDRWLALPENSND